MNRGLQDGGWPGVPSSHNVNIYVPITGLARLAIETFLSENNKFPPEQTTRMNQSASWASPWPALQGPVWPGPVYLLQGRQGGPVRPLEDERLEIARTLPQPDFRQMGWKQILAPLSLSLSLCYQGRLESPGYLY